MKSRAQETKASASGAPTVEAAARQPKSQTDTHLTWQPWQSLPPWGDANSATPPADPIPILTKLRVSEPDDPLERDADRMAEVVLRQPVPDDPGPLQGAAAETMPAAARDLFGSAGQPMEAPVRREFESRFGHDFSRVRIHTDEHSADSARGVDALAFTVGQDIAFSRGAYSPHSSAGRSLLAHELAHTVQSSQGLAGGHVQRRRVPSSAHLGSALPPAADTVGVMHARTGLARVLSRAWASLTPAQRASVQTAAAGFGITFTTEANLLTALNSASRTQLTQFADAVRTADPSRTLGDPALIDTGPRVGTSDAANINTVVGHANTLFTTIAGGSRDADIGQVFGTGNVATAKTKYASGASQMNTLKAANKIVTDRSGYNDEVGLGGLTNPAQISVHSSVIDTPNDHESIVTLVHESMHAGNTDVDDYGYINQPSFTVLPESVKLTNAAHFEVVPRRILGMGFAFPGVTFIPAGTSVGGVAAPALTPREEAVRGASERFRSAWTAGLNLHTIFVRLFRNPSEWSTLDLSTAYGVTPGSHFSDTLPFWSKVEALTMHTRLPHINPAGAPAVQPVTTIDIALSEGLTRKLSEGMNSVPQTAADALAFETAHATAAERTAAVASVNAERDLLIRLVIRVNLGSLTGSETRDARVVAQLAQAAATGDFSEYLRVRPPSAFP